MYLEFDVNTKKNLELVETLRNRERQYSLLWLLDKCKTAMGSRFLKNTILNPLTDRTEIERRYDLVSLLSTEFILRDDLIKSLEQVYDLERLVGRITYGNLNAKDLLQLKSSLKELPRIKEILTELKFDKKIETFEEVYSLLDRTILDDAPFTKWTSPAISTVSQSVKYMGSESINLLIKSINNEQIPNKHISVEVTYKPRQTTK